MDKPFMESLPTIQLQLNSNTNSPTKPEYSGLVFMSTVIFPMSKTSSLSFSYRMTVLYRFIIAFLLGYICTSLLANNLTVLFHHSLPKAESIYLAAFLSILFFLGYVISSFCIYSLRKLSVMSMILTAFFYAIYWVLG